MPVIMSGTNINQSTFWEKKYSWQAFNLHRGQFVACLSILGEQQNTPHNLNSAVFWFTVLALKIIIGWYTCVLF